MTSSTNTVKSRTHENNLSHVRWDGYRVFAKLLIAKGHTRQQIIEARHIAESRFNWAHADGVTSKWITYNQWSAIVKSVWAWEVHGVII